MANLVAALNQFGIHDVVDSGVGCIVGSSSGVLSGYKTLAEHELAAAPVLDGMAAIPDRLVVSCTDGSICCFADQ